MLEALGAEVVLVPQMDGAPGQVTGSDVIAATKVAQRIAVERQGFSVPDGEKMPTANVR
jgi:cysteine synthase A